MRKNWPHLAGLTMLAAAAASSASAQSAGTFDLGHQEFISSCAQCHGSAGRGDGPIRPYLTKAPSDLTTLAQRNGGAVPVQLVWEMIDGRTSDDLGPHGSREMPAWGQTYRKQALSNPDTAAQPEWYVRGRIVALIDYLQRIQQKK